MSDWLERGFQWLEFASGIETAEPGEGTVRRIEHAWTLAPWMTLLLVAGIAGWVLFCYLREVGSAGRPLRFGLTALRVLAIGLILLMIAELVLSRKRTGLPYVVVLVDDSASMSIIDRYDDSALRAELEKRVAEAGFEDASRFNLARTLLLENDASFLRVIDSRYRLRMYLLSQGDSSPSQDVETLDKLLRERQADGQTSRLGTALRHVLNDLRGTPPTAIVLLSDGINNEGESLADAAAYARRKGVPLFAVALGSDSPVRDLEVNDLLVDEVVFVDDVVHFEFKLSGSGYPGRRVDVVLRQKDKPDVLARQTVTIATDGNPQRIRLPYRPTEVGEFEYEVSVEPLNDELTEDNNKVSRLVSVRKEQIRVLLVQSYPNYEFRYLKHLFQRDNHLPEEERRILVKTVLQEADLEWSAIDSTALRTFPVRREDLFAFDVVIFGDVNPSFLGNLAMNNLTDFVMEKGGGILFMAGPLHTPLAYRDTPLAQLMPLEFGGASVPDPGLIATDPFQVVPTDLGLSSPTMQLGDTPEESQEIWRNLPPLYWLLDAPKLKPAARVLAEHPVRLGEDGRRLPVITMQYAKAGKVIMHMTDETWRWRFRVGDVFFARYWVQTIRYLSRSKLLGKDRTAELTVDRQSYQRGETVRLRVRFFDERKAPVEDDGVTVMVERLGEKDRQVTLRRTSTNRGVFEGTLTRPTDGEYHAWVAAPILEGSPPSTNFQVLAPLGEFERVQTDLPELKRAAEASKGQVYLVSETARLLDDLPKGRQVPIETLPPIVLWNRWPILMCFLTLLVTEWVVRKRKGML